MGTSREIKIKDEYKTYLKKKMFPMFNSHNKKKLIHNDDDCKHSDKQINN